MCPPARVLNNAQPTAPHPITATVRARTPAVHTAAPTPQPIRQATSAGRSAGTDPISSALADNDVGVLHCRVTVATPTQGSYIESDRPTITSDPPAEVRAIRVSSVYVRPDGGQLRNLVLPLADGHLKISVGRAYGLADPAGALAKAVSGRVGGAVALVL